MLGCFALWSVEGEVGGGGGGGGVGRDSNQLQSEYLPPSSIYSTFGPVHKYPDIFLKGDSISLLPLKRPSARKRRF